MPLKMLFDILTPIIISFMTDDLFMIGFDNILETIK